MNGKAILDTCSSIVKRQDLDRSLLLFLINTARRAIFRDRYNYRLVREYAGLAPMDGIVSVPGLKCPFHVEYCLDDKKVVLKKLNTYAAAVGLYPDLTVIGTPAHYIITENNNIRVIPMPPEGTITVYGEFYPADLADSTTSEDILSREVPEVLVYLGTAEYYDMTFEHEKAQYWRQKGLTLLEQYMKEIKRQQTAGVKLLARDPFGNLGLVEGKQVTSGTASFDPDTADGGEF